MVVAALFAVRIASAPRGGVQEITTPAPHLGTPVTTPRGSPVKFAVVSPGDGAVVASAIVTVSGTAPEGTAIAIGPRAVIVANDGTWAVTATLVPGINHLHVVATDATGKGAALDITITYVSPATSTTSRSDSNGGPHGTSTTSTTRARTTTTGSSTTTSDTSGGSTTTESSTTTTEGTSTSTTESTTTTTEDTTTTTTQDTSTTEPPGP